MSVTSTSSSEKTALIAKKLKKINVLVLDNSPQVTSIFQDMLGELGFSSVFVENSGAQGLEVLRKVKIDLIITDWDLKISPDEEQSSEETASDDAALAVSGVDFIKNIRFAPLSRTSFLPIILFADSVESTGAISARDAGVDEICLKPLTVDKLCSKITSVVESSRVFITAEAYRGPDRRRKVVPLEAGKEERRKKMVQVIKYEKS